MLSSLELCDWKSFGKGSRSRLPFAPLTLLVGPNASGKSNALDALRFLQGCALGYPVDHVLGGRWEGQRQIWPPIRGGIVEAARQGSSRFTLVAKWSFGSRELEYYLIVDTGEGVQIAGEGLFEPSNVDEGGDVVARFHSHGGGLRQLLGQTESEVRTALRQAVFLDIQPSLMRDYRPENGAHLGTSGENISPVLEALGRTPGRLEDIVEWLSELCAPEIERIEFDRTRLREVMMLLVERSGRTISARSASDGTLRFLGELVALLTCPEGSLVVLEEPDVGLHPSRIRLLAELLERVTAERNIQVVATTHSPTLLAHLSPEALGNVIAFGRDQAEGTTVCSRLKDLPHFATLRDAKDLEHLVSTGWLERAL
ncbi:AAA family ATPase [Pendulispora albinea]|uniref:AAA family ATPase n=1 Tax=Pendulispora albinea TaxID=2741071 RepID=A0ABZ2M178_9BACT